MILSLSLIYRILRSGFLRFTCGVCWKTSSSHDWNHLVLFLGLVPIVACTNCLPDKRLANTFHRRISPRPPANFLLVVSTVHERWFVMFANHQVLYIYVKFYPPPPTLQINGRCRGGVLQKRLKRILSPQGQICFFGTKTDARSLLAHRRSFCYFPE